MEMFDVITPDGTPTGAIISRKEAHQRGVWHKTAHIWIYSPPKGLLLQKRAAQKESYPNYWDISAAGHIPAGEDIYDAALREVEEELGLSFQRDDLQKLFTLQQQFDLADIDFYEREWVTVFLIISPVDLSNITLQKEEVASVQYILLKEFEKMVKREDTKLVPHWKEYNHLIKHLKK